MTGSERDLEALRLRATGWSLEDIASRLGWSRPAQAVSGIKRAISSLARFTGTEQRLVELEKLDQIEAELWKVMGRTHWAFTNRGDLVMTPDGEYMKDDRIILEAADRLMKVAERRAKLAGLDAPARAEIFTIDSVEAEIARVEAELKQIGQLKAIEGGTTEATGEAA